jgi:hypothetical protein
VTSETIQPRQSDLNLARAALLAMDSGQADACPVDEQLAAFIAGELQGHDRQHMLTHLDRCSSCYHQWLEIAADLEVIAHDPRSQVTSPPRRPSILTVVTSWFRDRWFLLPAVAMTSLVATVAFWPGRSSVEQGIDSAYAEVRQSITTSGTNASIADFPFPWEGSALGFSEAEPTPAAAAFRAGLLDGQRMLLPINAVRDKGEGVSPAEPRDPYYLLGRWMFLLWGQLGSDKQNIDWDWHQTIGNELAAQIRESKHVGNSVPAGDVVSNLLLGITATRKGEPGGREKLQRNITIAVQQLAYM